MKRMGLAGARQFDLGGMTVVGSTHGYRRGLRLATPLDRILRGRDKYRILDLKRRRAQIRARRELELG